MRTLADIYAGKRVLITGHTGFKGAWLTLWLNALGARVYGYALPPPTQPSLFELTGLAGDIEQRLANVQDAAALREWVAHVQPDIIFHLAAQPLVRLSYAQPLDTLATNVMGTAHLLEALRPLREPCVVVVITSDKCYENKGWIYGYRENDPIGGHDPYSMSKGCAELVVASWRRSFFTPGTPVRLASARAGNVIGGGDWAADRIMTDAVLALSAGKPIHVRNPQATRPWQHVLDPLSGYLLLAARLYAAIDQPVTNARTPSADSLASPWNFGPPTNCLHTVQNVVEQVIACWGDGVWVDASDPAASHEAELLTLCSDKATHQLGWQPKWGFERSIAETIRWYKTWQNGGQNLRALCLEQIAAHSSDGATV